MEKALTILMLLISQHLALVFSSLCFGTRLRKTLCVCVCVCVCVCARTPSHLVTSDAAAGSLSLPGEPQTGRHTERLRTHTCTHMPVHIHTCFNTHVSCPHAHLNTCATYTRAHVFKYITHACLSVPTHSR